MDSKTWVTCKAWLARLLILVMGFQEVAWSVPLSNVIEFQNVSPFRAKSLMDQAPNGVDLLQTFPCDTFGVFFNPYRQFDIGKAGLIFNNFAGSDPETMSSVCGKIGGLILENPLLKGRQAATKIVQSVEGGAPTRLSGPLEVYGKRAELILANPAGFILDNVRFLNMSKVTLITGKIHVDSKGALTSVDVQDQGSIQANFDEAYLDRVGQINLVSSLVKLSGETTLPAHTHVKVLSGMGSYDLQQDTFKSHLASSQPIPTVSPRPAYGIDAQHMQGLSVGSAHFQVLQDTGSLIAPQTLIARQGNLHLTAQGQVHLGNLKAKNILAGSHKDQLCLGKNHLVSVDQDVTLFSEAAWVQPENHHLVAGGKATLNSDADLTLEGKVQAQGNLEINAKNLTQTQTSVLQAQKDVQLSVKGGKVVQSGVITSLGGALTLTAETLFQELTAVLQAQSHATLSVDQQMTLRGVVFSHGGLLTLSAAALSQEQGRFYGGKGVLLTIAGRLMTLGEVTSQGTLKVLATSWTHGLLGRKASDPLNTLAAKEGIDVKITEDFHLGSKIEAGGILTVSAKQIVSQETGSLLGSKGVHLQGLEKMTTAGTILSDRGAVHLIAPLWQQTRGRVEGREGVTVHVEDLTTWGAIFSLAGVLLFRVKSWTHRLLNVLGQISPNALQGATGVVIEAEKTCDLEGSITATVGTVNLSAATFRLQEQGALSGNAGVIVNAAQVAETSGTITSAVGAVALTAPTWFHRKGAVRGFKDVTLKADQLTTSQGSLDSKGRILLHAKQWSAQDVAPKTWYTLRGVQGVDLQIEQEMNAEAFVRSTAGKLTLKTKRMVGNYSCHFSGYGGVEIAVETPWQHAGDIISHAGRVHLQAPSFRHTCGSLSGHQGVELTLSQEPLGRATLKDVVSEAGVITVKAHTVEQTGPALKGALGVVLNLTGQAKVDQVVSREGKIEITADALKPGMGNVIQGTRGITLNLKEALATQTHFLSPEGTLSMNAPSFQFGGTLQGKAIEITAARGIDVGSEVIAHTLSMQAPEVQICPESFVAASDIQLRVGLFALQGTILKNYYKSHYTQAIYIAPSGKNVDLPQDQPDFISQRLAQGPTLAPREVRGADKIDFPLDFRGVCYAGTIQTAGNLKVSGSQLLFRKGATCEAAGKLMATMTEKVENAGNLLAKGGMDVTAPSFKNTGCLGVVGKATFQRDTWLQTETGTMGVSGDLEIEGKQLTNRGQLDVEGELRGRFSGDVNNHHRISCGAAALCLDGNFLNRSETPGVQSIFVALNGTCIQGLTNPKAALIHNHASLLESLQGAVVLRARHILNARKVVVGRERETYWERWWPNMPPELAHLTREINWGEYSLFWLQRAFYDASRSEPEGQILANQDLTLEADLVENSSSHLGARGDIWVNGTLWQHGQKDYTYIGYRWKGGGSRVEYSNYCNIVHEFAPGSLLAGGRLRGDVKMKKDAPLPPPLKGARVTIPYDAALNLKENAHIPWGAHTGFAPQPQTNLQALAKTKLPDFAEQILKKAKAQGMTGSVALNSNLNPKLTFTPTVSLTDSSQKTLLNPQPTQVMPAVTTQPPAQPNAQPLASQPLAAKSTSLAPLFSVPPAPNAAQHVINLVRGKSLQVKDAPHLLLRTQGMHMDPKKFVSSDYVIQRITYFGNDPERVLRVGDGYFETQLIQDQILKLTGFPLLRGYTDLNTMIRTLYDNGMSYLEAQLEWRYKQHQHPRALQGPDAPKTQALANLRPHGLIRGPGKEEPLPHQDMLLLEPIQMILPKDKDEAMDQLALALISTREALAEGRPAPRGACAVLELWAPRLYLSKATLNQWRGGTVAQNIDLILGDEPLWGQTFEGDQVRFQNPSGDLNIFGGGQRARESLELISQAGGLNIYGTQLLGSGEGSKALLYGGEKLLFSAQTIDGQHSFGSTRHLGTSPTLRFHEALGYGGTGGLSIQSANLHMPKQLSLVSLGEIGIGALASELHSYEESVDNWYRDERIHHRLTQAKVGHLALVTPDKLRLRGLQVTGKTAEIQLGGGYLADSPQDFTHHAHHTESKGFFSSSSEDVSTTKLTTQRNVLAFQDATLSTPVFLDRAGAYGGVTVTTPRAQLEAVLDKLEYMESSTDSNLFFKSGENHGDIRHTAVFTTAQNLKLSTAHVHLDTPPGHGQLQGVTLAPFNPASLRAPQVEGLLQAFLGDSRKALSSPRPNEEVEDRRGNPENTTLATPQLSIRHLSEIHEHWDQSYFGLTAGAAATLGIGIALLTGGVGGIATQFGNAVAGGLGLEGMAAAVVSTMATAGAKAALVTAGVSLVNNQGNLGKTLEEMGQPSSLRGIGKSMLRAGLVGSGPSGGRLAEGFGENLAAHATQQLAYGLRSGAVSFALNGGSAEKAFKEAGLTAVANTVQASLANELGEARLGGMGFVEHKVLHGVVGAAAGAILDPENPGHGAASGAIGSVVAETVAECLPTSMSLETRTNWAQFAAGFAAFLTKQDVDIAAHTADTALQNNYAATAALLPGSLAAGCVLLAPEAVILITVAGIILLVAPQTKEGKALLAYVGAQTEAALEKMKVVGMACLTEAERVFVDAHKTGILQPDVSKVRDFSKLNAWICEQRPLLERGLQASPDGKALPKSVEAFVTRHLPEFPKTALKATPKAFPERPVKEKAPPKKGTAPKQKAPPKSEVALKERDPAPQQPSPQRPKLPKFPTLPKSEEQREESQKQKKTQPSAREPKLAKKAEVSQDVTKVDGVDLELSFKEGMNKRDFDRKISALQAAAKKGSLVSDVSQGVSAQERKGATRSYRKALEKRIESFYKDNPEAKVSALEKLKKMDIDHTIDLQLGGKNTPDNLKALDGVVNRSLGSQIQKQLPKTGGVEVKNVFVRGNQ
jgi:filamentous hemagglutinin family protein